MQLQILMIVTIIHINLNGSVHSIFGYYVPVSVMVENVFICSKLNIPKNKGEYITYISLLEQIMVLVDSFKRVIATSFPGSCSTGTLACCR